MSYAGLLNTTCTLKRRVSGTDDYGQPDDDYTGNGTADCRIQPTNVRSGNREIRKGKEVVISSHTLFLPTGTDITTDDRVTVGATTYSVLQVDDAAGQSHHIECALELAA